MHQIEHYWLFAAVCFVVAMLVFRLILVERVTLQSSLAFLVLLSLGIALAFFPGLTGWLSEHLGFSLPSNLLFALCIGALAVLHVAALIMHSRVEVRSVALTQELAILQERLDRLAREWQKERKAS